METDLEVDRQRPRGPAAGQLPPLAPKVASLRALHRAVRRVIATCEELSAEQRLKLLVAIDDKLTGSGS